MLSSRPSAPDLVEALKMLDIELEKWEKAKQFQLQKRTR